jgi:hypothetical protein
MDLMMTGSLNGLRSRTGLAAVLSSASSFGLVSFANARDGRIENELTPTATCFTKVRRVDFMVFGVAEKT